MKDVGLGACEKIPKPCLSQENVQEKLRFVRIYKEWTIEDWKRVVFSDEMKINCFNSDGRTWCRVNDQKSVKGNVVRINVYHKYIKDLKLNITIDLDGFIYYPSS